jgi:ketosteroid isomerase-like protein
VSDDSVQRLREVLDAMSHGAGVETLLPYLDPEIDLISTPEFLPDAEDYHGHDGVRAWFDKIGELVEDMRWQPEEIIDAGDRLVAAVLVSGRGRASGVAVELRQFLVVTVRDGKGVRIESYLDRDQALAAARLPR